MRTILWIAAGFSLLAGSGAVRAEVPLEGSFRASRSCEALVSIRKDTNPGHVITGPGLSYDLVAGNQKKPTFYRIIIPNAAPPERWVAADCGKVVPAQSSQQNAAGRQDGAGQQGGPGRQGESQVKPDQAGKLADKAYVLALSWQPAFCEAFENKRECRGQTSRRYDASYLSLHGLWPQPSSLAYCNQPDRVRQAGEGGRWKDIPPLELSLSTRADLEKMMPGSQSMLDRHEWAKHGSCYPADAETYFKDSFRLMRELNDSPVADIFLRNIGRRVATADIRAAFDQAFGKGAGNRVRVTCKDDGSRRLITELTIGLKGNIPGGAGLAELIVAADPTDPGCPAGVVDPVGPQ